MARFLRRIVHGITCRIENTKNAHLMKRFEQSLGKNPPELMEAYVFGQVFRVSPKEKIGKQLLALGQFEKVDTRYILDHATRSWTCIDAGANIGYYTVLLAGQTSMVHSFEPDPQARKRLIQNVKLNGFSNVIVNACALSDSSGSMVFSSARDSAFSSFKETGRETTEQTIRVETCTLDEYAKTQNLSSIDFLKIDVEGAELSILKGAHALLKERVPRLMMIELVEENLHVYNTSIREVVAYLQRVSYEPYVVDHIDGTLRQIKPSEFNTIQNIFFVPQ